jgi:hypothetical protein
MITGIDTGGLFAMTADSGKGGVFPQRGNAVILRMIKIIAADLAFFAFAAYLQINK